MEKTPDYVAGKERDPRNPPDAKEKKTEAENAAAAHKMPKDKS